MVNLIQSNRCIKLAWNWWFVAPPDFTSSQRRRDAVAAFTYLPSWITSWIYIFLFGYWGVAPLVVFNVFSLVFVWSGLIFFWRNRREKITYLQSNLMYWVVVIQVIAQTTLVIYFLGWGFGFQYILMIAAAINFTAPRKAWINYCLLALTTIFFVCIYYYTNFFPPIFVVPFSQLAFINIIHIAITFLLISTIVAHYISLFKRAEAALKEEHAKSEALLNNVLPTAIAARLKTEQGTIADDFANASILFADLAGFTPFSASLPPSELVNMLDAIFSRFDELVDRYGLEKIKTIGDEYMVAAGIPTPREDHAEALANLALAMRDSLADFNRHHNTTLQIRIGLNSGPVIAGVIGKRRFLYDLWGDSVNTASRMESHGVPGKIQVTEATRQLLDTKFSFSDRGIIEVKGKGPMQTYFLNANGVVGTE